METLFKHITDIEPRELTLAKNGNIILRKAGEKEQAIGDWSVSSEHLYTGGIPYKGQASGYSRNELKQTLCAIIKSRGIDIKQ